MKNRVLLLRTVILIAMLFALLIPSGAALAVDNDDDNKPKEVRLQVYNNSQFDFTLWLLGPAEYSITVAPESESLYFLKNGWYAFTMEYCNLKETGTLDFTSHTTMHVPICGGTAGTTGKTNNHYDASDYIRPATILIRNRTLETIGVYIRTFEENHFLTFEPQEERNILIQDASQIFTYSYVSCDVLRTGQTRLYIGLPFDLTCGKK